MNRFLALGSLLLAAMPLASRASPPPDFAPLAAFIQQTKEATALPSGTAIAVIKNGKVIYEGYFGYSDIAARTPVTRDTVFYIASATKPFFALNALLQEDAGRLDMRMSLHDMFPEGRFTGIDTNAVTMKDLLVHTSGVDNQPLVWATAYSGIHDARSLLGLVSASYPDEKAARGSFKYTNVGYNILSVWLDAHGLVSWQEQLERNVLHPLDMQRTSTSVDKARAAGWTLAKPYSFASAQPRQPLYIAKSDATMHAAGGLVSTAPDLAKFLIAELASGRRQAIPTKVIRRSHEPQVALTAKYMDFPRTGYAWGWYTGEYKGRTMLHHFGGFAGFHAHLSFMPDEGIALVVLNNEDVLGAQLTSLIADYVYGSLLGEPDVASTVSRRFDALRTKAAEVSRMAARQRETIQARAWALSRPRTEYAGRYSNELLGDMTVHVDEGRGMVIRWGNVQAVATGGDAPDRVRVEFAPNSGDFLDFRTENGAVTAISFEQMVFKKSPGEG